MLTPCERHVTWKLDRVESDLAGSESFSFTNQGLTQLDLLRRGSNQKYLAKSLCLSWLCWFGRHAAFLPPGKDSACSGHPFASKKVGFAARAQGACSHRRCGESPRVKLQGVSSEDLRTPICGQAVKQSAEMRSALEFFATTPSFRERSLESVN